MIGSQCYVHFPLSGIPAGAFQTLVWAGSLRQTKCRTAVHIGSKGFWRITENGLETATELSQKTLRALTSSSQSPVLKHLPFPSTLLKLGGSVQRAQRRSTVGSSHVIVGSKSFPVSSISFFLAMRLGLLMSPSYYPWSSSHWILSPVVPLVYSLSTTKGP